MDGEKEWQRRVLDAGQWMCQDPLHPEELPRDNTRLYADPAPGVGGGICRCEPCHDLALRALRLRQALLNRGK